MNCCKFPFTWQPWKGLIPLFAPPPPKPIECTPVAGFIAADTHGNEGVAGSGEMPNLGHNMGQAITITNTSTDTASYEWFVDEALVSTDAEPSLTSQGECGSQHVIKLVAYCEANQTGASDTISLTYETGCA